MIPKYTPPDVAAIFSDESRLRRWLQVELLACEGWSKLGKVPVEVLPLLHKARIDVDRIAALEAEQGHDVAAFVSGVQETLGDEGRFIHYGLTSSDVVDTALATQLRDAALILDADAKALEAALAEQAARYRLTVMPGRTHGVHAEPLTLGIKFANHFDEVRRSRERLARAAAEVSVGQISGAVGTHATVPPSIEEHVCSGLRLAVAPVATQVVARDRHAAFVTAIAILGAVLERVATTVRLCQQTDVAELEEPFSARQKGSSAMPHKRNPILSERIVGMARVLRGYAMTSLDNIALWHERDISHSSAERIILPDAIAALAYMLRLTTRVVGGIRVQQERMLANVERDGGIVYSQRILTALIGDAQWPREKAYRTVQALAARARLGEGGFRQLVREDQEIGSALTSDQLDTAFAVEAYLAHIDETFRRLGLSVEAPTADPTSANGDARSALAAEAGLGGGRS